MSLMSPALPPTLEDLLTDARWVRGLASALAGDPHAADDLAQDACLQALQRPPRTSANLRGWFLRVLQNLRRQQRRQRRRRDRREQLAAAARSDRAPAAAELVERATLHRAVVDAVLALDEPYRTAILLRFFEDLPPRAIAARLRLPVATVHTHLTRACDQLRARLDRAGAGRAAWVELAEPLRRLSPPAAPTLALGVMLMNWKLATSAVVLLCATAVLLRPLVVGDAPAPARGATTVNAPVPADTDDAHPLPADRADERNVVPPAAAPPATRAVAATDALRIRGRVVDADGRPAPGLHVVQMTLDGVVAPAAPTVASGSDGTFAFAAARAEMRIAVADAGWHTVMHALVHPEAPPRFALVVVAPAVALAGRVTGADGAPLPSARLRVLWPDDLRSRLSDNSDVAAEDAATATPAADGRFALAAAAVRGAELLTTCDGWLPERRPVPATDDRALAIALQRPVARAGTVQGLVLDGRGLPAAGARVALGARLVRCDADGQFLLDDVRGATMLQASMAGHRRAALLRPAGGFPAFVVLSLGPPPLQIRGRVVDAGGAAVAGAKVWLRDPTLLVAGREPIVTEGLASGAVTAAWPWARSTADGSFVLDGLEDRSYGLRAMQEETLLMADVADVAAGRADVVIRLPTDAIFARIAGVVVDRQGLAVAGVCVRAQCDTLHVGDTNMHAQADASAVTGQDGRFALASVPEQRVYLRLDGDPILPLEYGRGVAGGLREVSRGDAEHLRLVVGRRMHVQIELVDAGSADALSVLDAAGEKVRINVFEGRSRREVDTLQFTAGRTPVFVVPDSAATAILQKGGAEVRRAPLALQGGDVNHVRL